MVHLEYSSERKLLSKRTIIILMITAFGAIGVWFAARRLEPIIRWRISYLHSQAACLKWEGQAGHVAYEDNPEEDPEMALRLLKGRFGGPGYVTESDQDGNIVAFCSEVDEVKGLAYPPSGFYLVGKSQDVLFLHARHAAGCEARLVCIRLSNEFSQRIGVPRTVPAWAITGLECDIASVASLRIEPKILNEFIWSDSAFGEMTPKPVRIFFGTPDPVDESKFSILFQTPKEAKVIEGRLLPNDTLQFQIVQAPHSTTTWLPSTHP